jgi:riboflavin kinase/FMN adenylyltransferase
MYVFNGLESFPSELCGCAASIGKFDGIHAGHGLILDNLKSQAENRHIPAVVLTFDPPPIQIFRPDLHIRPLCTLERKLQLLEALLIDAVVVLPSAKEFFKQDAETFFNKIIVEKIKAKVLVEGMNFNFGNNRSGNADTLRDFGLKHGIETVLVEQLRLDNDNVVSSSGIRKMLEDGKIEQANELLYRPYQLCGTVVSGQQRGRTLGFPTANLSDIETVIPKAGVYASSVSISKTNGSKTIKTATTHIGLCPTFGVDELRVEVFIHDFNGDLYGQYLKVNLFSYLRGIIKYNSVDELVLAMKNDVAKSKEICDSKFALHKELFYGATS